MTPLVSTEWLAAALGSPDLGHALEAKMAVAVARYNG